MSPHGVAAYPSSPAPSSSVVVAGDSSPSSVLPSSRLLLLLLLVQVLRLLLLSLKTQLLSISKLVLRLAAVISWQRPLSTCVQYTLNTIKTPKFCIRCITIPSILNNWYCHSRIQSSTIVAFSLINEIGHNFDTSHKILYFFYPASGVSLRHLG